jgi:hypothetical protein
MSNQVYCAQFSNIIAPASSSNDSFKILNNLREMQIRSITIDWLLRYQATGVRIPPEAMLNQRFTCLIGTAVNKIGKSYSPGITPPTYNGNIFTITEPKQLIFNSFFLNNDLDFLVTVYNIDAANAVVIDYSIITEISETIKYF